MVSISKKHQFVLYALMKYLKKLNKKFEDRPLEASISKIDFIRLLKELDLVEKSERGLYKNLEDLEKKKLIQYENRFLKLTDRGLKLANEKEDELYPFIKLIVNIDKGASSQSRSPQTYFKG